MSHMLEKRYSLHLCGEKTLKPVDINLLYHFLFLIKNCHYIWVARKLFELVILALHNIFVNDRKFKFDNACSLASIDHTLIFSGILSTILRHEFSEK